MLLRMGNYFDIKKLMLQLVLFAIVLFVAFITGSLVALSAFKPLILLVAAVSGILFLWFSNEKLLSLLVVLAFFIVGQLNYFAGINQASWLPYLLAFIFYLKFFSIVVSDSSRSLNRPHFVTYLVISLPLFIIFSSVVNQVPILQGFLGARGSTIFVLGIFLVIVYNGISLSWFEKTWKFFPLLIAFQIPIVVYQKFVIAPKRIGRTDLQGNAIWDSVVGGFGGDPFGGGASPTLAFFIVVGMSYFTILFRKNLMSKGRYLFYLLLTLPSVLLAEIKVVFVLIPVALFIIFRDLIVKSPVKYMGLTFLVGLVVVFMMGFYQYQKTGSIEEATDFEVLYEKTFENQLDATFLGNYEMGRITVFKHWFSENGAEHPFNFFFGYGIGAIKSTPLFVGEINQKYGHLGVGRSAAAIYLWEYGLIGFSLFIAALLWGGYLAMKSSNERVFSDNQQAILEATSISLFLGVIMTVHSFEIINVPANFIYIASALGLAVLSQRLVK